MENGNGMKKFPVCRKHLNYIIEKYAFTPSPINGHVYNNSVSRVRLIKHLNGFSTDKAFINAMNLYHINWAGI